jgi:hypothetical protein
MIIKYYSSKEGRYKRLSIWTIFFILFAYPIIFYIIGRFEKPCEIIEKKHISINECPELETYLEFNENNFINFLKDINVKFPELVYTQAYHETDKFSSDLFKHNNNLFGMGVPKQRAYLSVCDTCKNSKFIDTRLSGWQMSVLDYALWQNKYGNYNTENEYLEYLGRVYAEDSIYIKKLKILKQQLWQ